MVLFDPCSEPQMVTPTAEHDFKRKLWTSGILFFMELLHAIQVLGKITLREDGLRVGVKNTLCYIC